MTKKDGVVCEPHDVIAVMFEHLGATLIVFALTLVYFPVNFNDQPDFRTAEVDVVWSERVLTSELQPAKPAAT